jgi:hypothetical protein
MEEYFDKNIEIIIQSIKNIHNNYGISINNIIFGNYELHQIKGNDFYKQIFELSSCLCSTNLECKKYCGIDGCIDIENQISNNICQQIIKENKEKDILEKILMFVPRNSFMPILSDMYNFNPEIPVEERRVRLWLLGISVNKIELIKNPIHFNLFVDFIINYFGQLDKKYLPNDSENITYLQKNEYIKYKIIRGFEVILEYMDNYPHHEILYSTIKSFVEENDSDIHSKK